MGTVFKINKRTHGIWYEIFVFHIDGNKKQTNVIQISLTTPLSINSTQVLWLLSQHPFCIFLNNTSRVRATAEQACGKSRGRSVSTQSTGRSRLVRARSLAFFLRWPYVQHLTDARDLSLRWHHFGQWISFIKSA